MGEYEPLVGKTFRGTYLGKRNFGSETDWDVIEVTRMPSEMQETLQNIRDTVEGRVWKGFTGPPEYKKYWLFAVVTVGMCTSRNEYTFKITEVVPYSGEWRRRADYTDHCGFCIQLSVV